VAYKNFKDDRQLNRLKSAPKWDAMISKIAEEISALSLAAKEGRKARYPAMSRAVLQSIKEMLGACGAVDRESQLLSQNIPLRDAHSDIMNSLSRFVGFANAARKVWPPPDAATEMRFELERINLALRKFVDLAIDANVDLKEIATGPPEKKAVAAPPVFIEDNVTHVPPPLPLPLPRQNSQMNLPAVGSGSELIGKLEEVFQSIKKAVKTLLDLKNNSGTIEQIIFYAKKVLADGGCFATLFDEFSVEEALGVVKSKVEAQRLLKENQMLRSTA
jgi:hypothetical protein